MTKNEFIQEAALRLITAWSDAGSFTTEELAQAAKQIADNVWEQFDDDKPEKSDEPAYNSDTVQVLMKEIARIEKEEIDEKNRKSREDAAKHGWCCYTYQSSGADVRFVNICRDERRCQVRIDTIGELISCGRNNFSRRLGVGKKTLELIDKTLENLYNIKTW